MFRRLISLSMFFARKTRNQMKNLPSLQQNQEEDQNQFHTISTQFQKIKQDFKRLDEQKTKNKGKSQDDPFSLDNFKKIMKNAKKDLKQDQEPQNKKSIASKLKGMDTPQQLLNPQADQFQPKTQQYTDITFKNDKKLTQQLGNNVQQSEESKRFMAEIMRNNNFSQQQIMRKSKNQLKMAQQQLLLDEIMKNSKEKQLKIRTKYKKDDTLQITDDQKRLILRRQKIMQALQKNQDPSQLKYDITKEDLLKMNYSPQIIQKAKTYKNNELGYLKELIVNQNQDEQTHLDSIHKRKKLTQKQPSLLQGNKKSKEIKFQKKQGLIKQKQKDQDLIISDDSRTINSYKDLKTEQGITLYQDEKFYKEKVTKQLKQRNKLTQEDIKLKKQLEKDLDEGNQSSNIFLDEVVYPFDAKITKKIQYRQTSFGQQQKRIKTIQQKFQKLGIQFSAEEIKSISKQALFQQKHFLEQQQAFQKYLHKKEKKKNMKKQLKQIHMNVLKHDVDFDKQSQPSMTVKQIKNSSNFEMLESNLQRLEEYEKRKESVLVTETPDQKRSKIHHMKTFRNMQNFVVNYFAQGIFNSNVGQLDRVQILKIIPNKINTVLNVFWLIQPKYLQEKGIVVGSNKYEQKFKEEKIKLQTHLKNQSKFISKQMTNALKLRYGPDIRFHYELKTDKTQQTIDQLSKYVKEIAMDEVKQYKQKGLIRSQKQEIQYFTKLIDVAKSNLHQYNDRKYILSKAFRKQNPQQPKKQVNPNQNDMKRVKKRKNPIFEQQDEKKQDSMLNKKTSNKKRPSDKLWDTIELL